MKSFFITLKKSVVIGEITSFRSSTDNAVVIESQRYLKESVGVFEEKIERAIRYFIIITSYLLSKVCLLN